MKNGNLQATLKSSFYSSNSCEFYLNTSRPGKPPVNDSPQAKKLPFQAVLSALPRDRREARRVLGGR